MGARKKLNSAYFLGSLVLACTAGLLTESWFVLVVALTVLTGLNLHNGDIRLGKRRDR